MLPQTLKGRSLIELERSQQGSSRSKKSPDDHSFPWTDELGRIHCLQNRRLIHTGTAVLGNQTDFYKPPPLTEADMQFLRDVRARAYDVPPVAPGRR